MILWRKIDDKIARKWDAHFAAPQTYVSHEDVPIWAIATFLPDPNDKDCGVSTYAAAEKTDLELVAAAMNLKENSDTYNFVGATLTAIQGADLSILQTVGTTRLHQINQNHYDVKIQTASQAARLAFVYLSGSTEKIQKRAVKLASQLAARCELIDFSGLANDNNPTGNRRLIDFIACDDVVVSGNQTQ